MQKSLFLRKRDNRKAQKNNKFLYPMLKTGICYQSARFLYFLFFASKKV